MSVALAHFLRIEGMTGALSGDIWEELFKLQEETGVRGDLFETGTYKGKTAVLLAYQVRNGEHLHLVDVHPHLEIPEFESFVDRYSLYIGDSADAQILIPNFAAIKGQVRFLHTDASHGFENVESDLVLAEELLSERGIVAVDDYSNPFYPQVAAAIFYTLFVRGLDLAPFMIADNKMYLCRHASQREMKLFVRDILFPKMKNLHPSICIGKTDVDSRFDLYTFNDKPNSGDDDPYGREIFGEVVARN